MLRVEIIGGLMCDGNQSVREPHSRESQQLVLSTSERPRSDGLLRFQGIMAVWPIAEIGLAQNTQQFLPRLIFGAISRFDRIGRENLTSSSNGDERATHAVRITADCQVLVRRPIALTQSR
jgi:hypothetical protein